MQRPQKKPILRIALGILAIGVIGSASWFLYLWFEPHRDIQATPHDYKLSAAGLVREYLADPAAANLKYLAQDGDSKILIVEGRVASIRENQKGDKVLHLREDQAKFGINCVFMPATNEQLQSIHEGDAVRIKGVIRSGAEYDPDLNLYYHVLLEKCGLVLEKEAKE